MEEKTVELFVREAEAGKVVLVLRDADGEETALGVASGNKRERLDGVCELLQDNIEAVQNALCELL
jgi:hypothetical protein